MKLGKIAPYIATLEQMVSSCSCSGPSDRNECVQVGLVYQHQHCAGTEGVGGAKGGTVVFEGAMRTKAKCKSQKYTQETITPGPSSIGNGGSSAVFQNSAVTKSHSLYYFSIEWK